MEIQNNLQKNIGIFFGIVVILGVLFVTIFWGKQSTNTSNVPIVDQTQPTTSTPTTSKSTTPTPVVTQTPPVDTPKKSSYTYKDGTYSATGSYMSPGGYDQLGVSITIKNDIVTASTATNMAGDGRSQRYEDRFISGYKQYVIGKNIANIYLTNVSGSSLTPKGFNDALTQIKSQAQA